MPKKRSDKRPETVRIQTVSGSSSVCRFKGTNKTKCRKEVYVVGCGIFLGKQSRVI